MKKVMTFEVKKLTNKHLKTIKGGEDATTVPPAVTDEEDIDRGGGRPKTNG
ncbi:hypothetical protein GOQ30_11490 [Flavobacterium sp. TP390]|uniref:Uncharacterized protein n=1 Tax=Flavobacterium profundi TaxID=1774945 RepID=A0A6I4IM86_9FLAO|nr:hypothetical protein [Flavobacterium profundi]MVO09782.1 hypothetical protein [Flavobacterium profundi]